jgi:hypothetical protein
MGGETPKGLELDFLVAYPREAEVGKKYLMTVDLRVRGPVQAWPYEEEEYPLYLMVDSEPAFTNEPVGQGTVVLHRFGGTYGPAQFVLTARKPMQKARVSISLVNSAGLSLRKQSLPDMRVVPAVAAVPAPRVRPPPKAPPPDSIGWLHLSNLMMGEGRSGEQEHAFDVFLEDLEQLYEQCGPWDLIFCSGDLTLRARTDEFGEVSGFFGGLEARLRELGMAPRILAVPGNHDMERKSPSWDAVQTDILFSNYSRWWAVWSSHLGDTPRTGLLPGDFSTVFERGGVRLGIVGLNDVLEAGRNAKTLQAQLNAVCEGGFDSWSRGFDACVVLAHERLRVLEDQWAQRKQGEPFLLHLAGRSSRAGIPRAELSSAPTLVLHGRKLFPSDAGKIHRGYLAGRLSFETDKGRVRLWPRRARWSESRGLRIEADRISTRLDADEAVEAAVFTRPSPGVREAREDWAIVVGISRYPGMTDAQGSENSAQAFKEWLLDHANVPPEHVSTLLSSNFLPMEGVFQAKPGAAEIEALFDRLAMQAIANGKQRGNMRVGRRLYLYVSGCRLDLVGTEPVLLTADATPSRLSHIAPHAYAEWFRRTGSFEEVLLFFDCGQHDDEARNVPLRLPPYMEAATGSGVEGRLFSAHAPRSARMSPGADGLVHGDFTSRLLAGLTGDASDNDGRVTARSLADYLSSISQQAAGAELPEVVYDAGASEDFVIARVPPRRSHHFEEAISPETLLLNAIDGETGRYQVPLIGLDIGVGLALNFARKLSPDFSEDVVRRYVDMPPQGPGTSEWGVVFGVNARPALREALAPLIALRQESTRSAVRVLECRPGETARQWLGRHERLPYHLLLVGGPEEISFEFQRELGLLHSVGRLSFFTEDEYARYVSSVTAHERGLRAPSAKQITYWGPRHPEDEATGRIHDLLLTPLSRELSARQEHLLLGEHATIPALAEALCPSDGVASGVVFAAGHGVAFRSDPLRYRLQGGLLSQDWIPFNPVPKESILAADNFFKAPGPLSPIAFFFASFSAGTSLADPIARTLFRDQPVLPPVVAAVPRQLLSHPGGATLAVLGQVDWAWAAAAGRAVNARAYLPYSLCLRRIVAGEPVGHAVHEEFGRRWALAARQLTDLLDGGVRKGTIQGPDVLRELLNLLDARSLVVLGDPAVRLNLQRNEDATELVEAE